MLRRSYREDGKVKNETLGNLSHLPDALVDLIRRSLQGETFVPLDQAFEVVGSRSHGAVHVIAAAMQRLRFASLLATKTSRERDLVCAMIAARIIAPHTKLATTRKLEDGTPAHSFSTLMDELSTIVRNTCRAPHTGPDGYTFEVVTTANPKQRHALELIQQMQMQM